MVEIFFDPKLHKYTDANYNAYTSVTTVIGKYEHKFSDNEWEIATACAKAGRNPKHKNYKKYKGKTAKQLIMEWKKDSEVGKNIGNVTHDYLETSVKEATGFNKVLLTGGKLFTVVNLLDNNRYGKLNLDYFINTGINIKYPKIFKLIELFVNDGWSIYSEICTFSYDHLVAGLIDILLIKGNNFIILDWKTNKAPLRFESGYYEKDEHKNITNYVFTDTKFKEPLSHLPYSVGNKYTLQLSEYAWLTEQFGLVCQALILCHIRHDLYTKDSIEVKDNPKLINTNVTDLWPITYLKNDVDKMTNAFSCSIKKPQLNLFLK